MKLTRKYADVINGVDLRDAKVGDQLELPHHEAGVLVAEGWAEDVRASSADSPPRGPRRHGR